MAISDKVKKFILWLEAKDYKLPSKDLYQQYMLEEDIEEELTQKELKYIDLYQKNKLIEMAYTGVIKSDIAKFILSEEFNYGDKSGTKSDFKEWVVFDLDGLDEGGENDKTR